MSAVERGNGYIDFKAPHRVGGKEVFLLADEVAERSKYDTDDAVRLAPATGSALTIWLRDTEILEARKLSGSLPLYGFWQCALHSGALDLSKPLYVAFTGSGAGTYLICREGKAVNSARFSANYIADATVGLDQAVVITEDNFRTWKLPKIQARPLEELRRSNERRQAVALLRFVGICAATIGVFASVDFFLNYIGEQRTDDINRMHGQASSEKSKLEKLRSLVNDGRFPDQKGLLVLDRVTAAAFSSAQIHASFDSLTLAGGEVTIQSTLPYQPLGFPAAISMRPDGTYDIAFSIDVKQP